MTFQTLSLDAIALAIAANAIPGSFGYREEASPSSSRAPLGCQPVFLIAAAMFVAPDILSMFSTRFLSAANTCGAALVRTPLRQIKLLPKGYSLRHNYCYRECVACAVFQRSSSALSICALSRTGLSDSYVRRIFSLSSSLSASYIRSL